MKENGWNKNCFLTDGFPRSQQNWDSWKKVVGDEAEIIGVLLLDCSEENMRKRILKRGETSGRNDDNEDVLVKRFKVFQEETQPVLDQFKEQNKLYTVDANGDKEDVRKEAIQILENLGIFQDRKEEGSFEIRNYLKTKVDIFVKPMMTDLMKERPEDVYEFLVNWINTKGADIKNQQ